MHRSLKLEEMSYLAIYSNMKKCLSFLDLFFTG